MLISSGMLVIFSSHLGSLPTRDGLLCAVCMLLCMALGFAVLPGVLMNVFIHGGINCLNSVPYRCYTHVCIEHRHWFHWTAV